MRKIIVSFLTFVSVFILTVFLTACGPVVHQFPPAVGTLGPLPSVDNVPASPNNVPAAQTETATPVSSAQDVFSALTAPSCVGTTPEDQEGPYYTTDTPERNSLLEDNLQGNKLVLIGYVLDSSCHPIPNAWLDFWQADANGEYDNSGYTLRGHQLTDDQGRYYLETIIPGIYSSRPIRHLHVKVQAPSGGVFTTQLYFPEQPIDKLTIQLTEKNGEYLGVFNFVLP